MATSTLEVIIRGRDELSGAVRSAANSLNGLRGAAAGLGPAIAAGLGVGIGLSGLQAVTRGVEMLRGAIESMIAGALDDERSVSRLNVAINDSIPAWDGNTTAIEKAVSARASLGFQDEALRDSLSTLVTSTHDVTSALEYQNLAMDIARARGIDLGSATDLVAKAVAGNATALRRAIPSIQAGATAQQALQQAIAATQGQAEAFAKTAVGALEAAQARLDATSDRLGSQTLPIVADAVQNASNSLEVLNSGFDVAGEGAQNFSAGAAILDTVLAGLTFGLSRSFAATMDLMNAQREGAVTIGEYAAAEDRDRVAIGQTYVATQKAEIATTALIDAYTVARHSAEERADAEEALTGALAAQASQAATTAAATVAAHALEEQTGQTASEAWLRYGAAQAQAARDAAASAKAQSDAAAAMARSRAAASELASVIGTELARSYDSFRDRALDALARIHEAKLQAIADAQRQADAEYEAQRAAIEGPVNEAQAALDAVRAQRQLRDAREAVSQAVASGDAAAIRSARERLSDVMAQRNIDRLREEATAQTEALDAKKRADDQVRADAKAAEDKRYADQKEQFAKDLAALQAHLTDVDTTYRQRTADLTAFLKKYGLTAKELGKTTGAAYAAGVAEGLGSLIPTIAGEVADLLGAQGRAGQAPPKYTPPKATGGAVAAGQTYLVGERGPELWTASRSGYIVPNDALGGRSIVVPVYLDGRVIAEVVDTHQARMARL